MPRPSKSYTVITSEKKSHRTKAELAQRKKGEEALLSGKRIKELPEVKENEEAHKAFRHAKSLLTAIEKDDDLYGATINRYCLITAEVTQLQKDREYYQDTLKEMREDLHDIKEQVKDPGEYIQLLADIGRSMAKITASISSIDRTIQQKRKMLLDIEKESSMTIAAALRLVQKKPEEKKNALLEALSSG